MKVAVLADDKQWQEVSAVSLQVNWVRCLTINDFVKYDADIYINMAADSYEKDYHNLKKTILLNSVVNTLKEMNTNENVLRINGWDGFLERSNWEVAGRMNEQTKQFFSAIKKTFTIVPDEPGLVSARIISMIVNEAYFALDENLSTRGAIDIAMKYGVNYPYGPFEWSEKIGIKNIYMLLQKLSKGDKRYMPAPLLQKQAML